VRTVALLILLALSLPEGYGASRGDRTTQDTFPRMRVMSCAVCGDPKEHHTNYGALVFNEYVYRAGPKIFADALTGTPYVKVVNPTNGKFAVVWIEFIYDPSPGTKLTSLKINVQPSTGKAISYTSAAVLIPHVIEPVDPRQTPRASPPQSASPARRDAGRGGRASSGARSTYIRNYYYGPIYGGGRTPRITITELPRDGR